MLYRGNNIGVFLFFSIFFAVDANTAKNNYHHQSASKLSWLNDNIITVLSNACSKSISPIEKQVPTIGFFSADLKFDGENIKFCEIGNGLYGVPVASYSIINGKKEILYPPYWDLCWLFLKQFNLPIWYIGNDTTNGAKTLHEIGGKRFASINEFKSWYRQYHPAPVKQFRAAVMSDYVGILAYAGSRDFSLFKRFKNDFPNILFVNDFDNLFLRQKDKIHEFFNCNELKAFRPRWKTYPTTYTQKLAKTIKKDIPANFYVIKPSMGRKAEGVVLIPSEQLDAALKSVLHPTTQKDGSLDYKINDWKKKAHAKTFIVEEYIPSKTIYFRGKPYDPTLRAAFVAHYESGKITTTFLSCFWKKPPSSLKDKASLTDKHITKSMLGCKIPAQEVDQKDMQKLTAIFNTMLPALYEKMLLNLK